MLDHLYFKYIIRSPENIFRNRCLGVSDWKTTIGAEDGGGETGEGSGASGEDAWGTPSSGDLSDNLPDSEHGTLSVRVDLIFCCA